MTAARAELAMDRPVNASSAFRPGALSNSRFDLVDGARLARRVYRPDTEASPTSRTAEFAFCLEPVRNLASRRAASRKVEVVRVASDLAVFHDPAS
jgi:hypothetical protein